MQSELSELRLYQLISPTLPIGGFTYSQGLEWAVENNWVNNRETLNDWLINVLVNSLQSLDLPVFIRLKMAIESQNKSQFYYWSQTLIASRETAELRTEEINRARALYRILEQLPDISLNDNFLNWRDAILKTQLGGYAIAACCWQINTKQAMTGFAWNYLENMISVAVKLIPLGQSDGQLTLHQLSTELPMIVNKALLIKDEDIGACTPALSIASSLHETQYTRLFRS